jgi:hypothetical protein
MTITLADSSTTLTLSPDLQWADENNWHPVEQIVERTLTGALIVSAAARLKGRPITLQPADEGSGWMTKSTVESLRNLAAVPGKTMTLTLSGAARTVMFRHEEGSAVEATPVVFYSDQTSTDYFLVVLRFMEI